MSEHATREEIEHLRSQITQLRKHYPTEQPAVQTLVDSMDRLHKALDKLVVLLESANKEIYDEYDKGMHDELAKLDKLSEQNEKIARGIVAIADMLKRSPAQPQAPQATQPVPQPQFAPAVPPQQPSMPAAPIQTAPPPPAMMPGWQSPSGATVQQNFRTEDSPFMQQPVVTPQYAQPPPSPAAATFPPVGGVQFSAASKSLPDLPSLPPLSRLAPVPDVPAPLPPPPAPAKPAEPMSYDQRRSLLEKFSFR